MARTFSRFVAEFNDRHSPESEEMLLKFDEVKKAKGEQGTAYSKADFIISLWKHFKGESE